MKGKEALKAANRRLKEAEDEASRLRGDLAVTRERLRVADAAAAKAERLADDNARLRGMLEQRTAPEVERLCEGFDLERRAFTSRLQSLARLFRASLVDVAAMEPMTEHELDIRGAAGAERDQAILKLLGPDAAPLYAPASLNRSQRRAELNASSLGGRRSSPHSTGAMTPEFIDHAGRRLQATPPLSDE